MIWLHYITINDNLARSVAVLFGRWTDIPINFWIQFTKETQHIISRLIEGSPTSTNVTWYITTTFCSKDQQRSVCRNRYSKITSKRYFYHHKQRQVIGILSKLLQYDTTSSCNLGHTAKHQQMYQLIAAGESVPFCHGHLERDLHNPVTHTSIVPALGKITCDLQSTHQ